MTAGTVTAISAAPSYSLARYTGPDHFREVMDKIPRGDVNGNSGQGHGLCPAHDDRKASLSIRTGTKGRELVWKCAAGCTPEAIRQALITNYGIPEDWLGTYCAPDSWRPRTDLSRDRREEDRRRAELATARREINRLRTGILALLGDESVTRETDLRARLLLLAEDAPTPDAYKAIKELALRAGAKPTQAKSLAALWLTAGVISGGG